MWLLQFLMWPALGGSSVTLPFYFSGGDPYPQCGSAKERRHHYPYLSSQLYPCHLLYADDILFFTKVQKKGLRKLKDLLKLYQYSSRQCFKLQKSNIYLGKSNARRANVVTKLLQIKVASPPLVYLGVPYFLD